MIFSLPLTEHSYLQFFFLCHLAEHSHLQFFLLCHLAEYSHLQFFLLCRRGLIVPPEPGDRKRIRRGQYHRGVSAQRAGLRRIQERVLDHFGLLDARRNSWRGSPGARVLGVRERSLARTCAVPALLVRHDGRLRAAVP